MPIKTNSRPAGGNALPADASAYRPHVDGLRAVAVLAVIANHFHHGLLPSGFLGVDIFFVISGFVVTSSLLDKRHASWKEYLLGFYVRRFKRLVPALAVSVLFTCLMTFLLISPPKHVFRSGAFSLIGMSNLYFLKHATNYFATAAELNPFTHTWSLGVEEQFYFVFPMLLGLCGYCVGRTAHAKRNLILAVAGIGLPSLAGYLYLSIAHPSAAFFLMPARLWEFGAGCLICVTQARARGNRIETSRLLKALSLLALAAVIGILCLPMSAHLYSVPLMVAATAALIWLMNRGTPAARILSASPVVGIGLASYSLYLWHWPMLALSRYVSGINAKSIPVLILLIVFFSWVSLRYIERPLRKLKWSRSEPRAFAVALCSSLACFAFLGVVLPKIAPENKTLLAKILKVPEPPGESYAFLGDCYQRDVADHAARLDRCLTASRSDSAPKAFYLLGDSHAQKLANMTKESIKGTAFEFLFLIADSDADFPYADHHRVPASANLEKVLRDSRAGDVLVLTFHRGHLNNERDVHVGEQEDAGPNGNYAIMRDNMDPYIAKLTAKGVRILFIRDVPLLGSMTTVETCVMQAKFFGSSPLCRVAREADMRTRRRQDLLVDSFAEAYPGVTSWDPAPYMYKDGWFNAYDEMQRYLMIDWHHISMYQESLLIGPFKDYLSERVLMASQSGVSRPNTN
jgi:peptidoglycan/LPS O-acetylase OafA/YrhL